MTPAEEPEELLVKKWERESLGQRAKLKKMIRSEILSELEKCGVYPELLDEIDWRLRNAR